MELSLQPPTPKVTVMSGVHKPMISTEKLPPSKTLDEFFWRNNGLLQLYYLPSVLLSLLFSSPIST